MSLRGDEELEDLEFCGQDGRRGAAVVTGMDQWIEIAALLAAWIVVQRWVLPRFGVPT